MSRLEGIVSTLAQQVDRSAVGNLYKRFPFRGDTAGISQDPTYRMYCELFERTKQINDLKTPIYTLTYDSLSSNFYAGIASNGQESYGWQYKSPPPQLKAYYSTGGRISRFEDDHGSWLSAIQPLTDSSGNVVAIIEADYPFDSFIREARATLFNEVAISVLVLLLIGGLTYPVLDRILKDEELSRSALENANRAITEKNAEIVSSLEYARSIRESMLPSTDEMASFLPECMIFNRPRDIVSGDFYWFHQLDRNRALVAVADCTGHGVPGALMSIMGHNYLNELTSPSEILEALNEKIRTTFCGEGSPTGGSDGMDEGICLIDKQEGKLRFSGARRPLMIIHGDQVNQIKGSRRGIGEHHLTEQIPFKETEVNLQNDAMYYLCTDGLQEQFGGPGSKKLMMKRLLDWFMEIKCLAANRRSKKLSELFVDWKQENPQVDDVCVVGFSP